MSCMCNKYNAIGPNPVSGLRATVEQFFRTRLKPNYSCTYLFFALAITVVSNTAPTINFFCLLAQVVSMTNNLCYLSRHTIVCRAAQEAGAPHREYINRKKENAIFTPM